MKRRGDSPKSHRNVATNSNHNNHAELTTESFFKVSLSPSGRKSSDETIDMLCPICEETCSCNGAIEQTIKPSSQSSRKLPKTQDIPPSSTSSALKRQANAKKSLASVKRSRNTKNSPTGNFMQCHQIQLINHLVANKDTNKPARMHSGDASVPPKRKTLLESRQTPRPVSIKTPSISGTCDFYSVENLFFVSGADEQQERQADLDQQYALSEYYFSDSGDDEDCEAAVLLATADMDNDSDILANYYGYSSGSDIALESLFIGSSEGETDEERLSSCDSLPNTEDEGYEEDLEYHNQNRYRHPFFIKTLDVSNTLNIQKNSTEEMLAEQLAKITPQILAAISVATKNSAGLNAERVTRTRYYVDTTTSSYKEEKQDTALRLDDLMDTKKLSVILSTSPPQQDRHLSGAINSHGINSNNGGNNNFSATTNGSRRHIPLDAFRSTIQRRPSIQQSIQKSLIGAFKSSAMANCTLMPAPTLESMGLDWPAPQNSNTNSTDGQNLFDVTVEIEVEDDDDDEEEEADDESDEASGNLSDLTESIFGAIDVPYGHFLF